MPDKAAQNLVDHIALVLDASHSMLHLESAVIRTADKLIEHLAEQYRTSGRETRVSVYVFGDDVECTLWDMDVLRLPSMKDHYKNRRSNTALIDATFLALDDGDLVTEKYGDHAFLVYVLTDGEENASKGTGKRPAFGRTSAFELTHQMRTRLAGLQDNRTVGILVPDDASYQRAKNCGFDNIVLWDATTEKGLEEAVSTVKTATDSFLTARTTGLRSARGTLFVGATVDAAQVKKNLTPLPASKYTLVPVTSRANDESFEKRKKPTKKYPEGEVIGRFIRIDDFINRVSPPFIVGKGYYQLFSADARKSEKVQGNKDIAILEKKTSQLYVGPAARQIVGLPDHDVTVKPGANPDYEIFVKSTSENRHLPIGTKLLLLNS